LKYIIDRYVVLIEKNGSHFVDSKQTSDTAL